jgi:hypothetical protein
MFNYCNVIGDNFCEKKLINRVRTFTRKGCLLLLSTCCIQNRTKVTSLWSNYFKLDAGQRPHSGLGLFV